MSTLLKKISAKNVCGEIKDIENVKTKPVKLFTVFGRASGIKTGVHATNGEWTGLTGDFVAVNLMTGEEFNSPRCHIPEPALGMVVAALADNDTVDFALEIGSKPSSTPYGYEYTVSPLVKAQESDALAHLRGIVQASLPAPAKAEAVPAPKAGKK